MAVKRMLNKWRLPRANSVPLEDLEHQFIEGMKKNNLLVGDLNNAAEGTEWRIDEDIDYSIENSVYQDNLDENGIVDNAIDIAPGAPVQTDMTKVTEITPIMHDRVQISNALSARLSVAFKAPRMTQLLPPASAIPIVNGRGAETSSFPGRSGNDMNAGGDLTVESVIPDSCPAKQQSNHVPNIQSFEPMPLPEVHGVDSDESDLDSVNHNAETGIHLNEFVASCQSRPRSTDLFTDDSIGDMVAEPELTIGHNSNGEFKSTLASTHEPEHVSAVVLRKKTNSKRRSGNLKRVSTSNRTDIEISFKRSSFAEIPLPRQLSEMEVASSLAMVEDDPNAMNSVQKIPHNSHVDNDSAYDTEVLSNMEKIAVESGMVVNNNVNDDTELWEEQCAKLGLPKPLRLTKFKSINWNHLSKYCIDDFSNGPPITLDDMKQIPRRWKNIPFCHPGPMINRESNTNGWYYPDMILAKLHLGNEEKWHYIVRWVGYEDEYNTLEAEAVLKDTAVLDLFEFKDWSTASRAGIGLLRRSLRQYTQLKLSSKLCQPKHKHHGVYLLDEMLQIEEEAQRYRPTIGFISPGTAADALTLQFEFVEKQFFPLIDTLSMPGCQMSRKIFGSIFSHIAHDLQLQEFNKKCTTDPKYIKTLLEHSLPAAVKSKQDSKIALVSHLVMTKYDYSAKSEKHMDMHMSVYTIWRDSQKKNHAVYFDPAPKTFSRPMPRYLERLQQPKIASITRRYGEPTEKEDCFYQSLKYIIEVHTGQIPF